MDAPGLNERDTFPSSAAAPAASSFRMNRLFPIMPLAGLVGILAGINFYRPIDTAPFYWTGVPLSFLSMFLVWSAQAKAKSGEDVSSLFPIATGLAFAPAFIAAILFVNGTLDFSSAEHHEEIVINKTVRHGKSTLYFIEYSSWRPNRLSEKVQVSSLTYYELQVNDQIVIDEHRGALHIPWVGTIRKAN